MKNRGIYIPIGLLCWWISLSISSDNSDVVWAYISVGFIVITFFLFLNWVGK